MADRTKRSSNDTPDLVAAARDGDLLLVKQFVEQGRPLDVRDKDGATALYWACCRGHDNISKLLLNAGCDITVRVKSGATALLAAADNGHEACLRQLLCQKADVNTANDRGDTPLHAAAYRGYLNIVRLLTAASANPFMKNGNSMTPVQEAVAQRKSECVRHLNEYMKVLPGGTSGSLFLSSPTLAYDVSHAPSMRESCQSWPSDTSGRSKYQQEGYHSFPLQKRNNDMNASQSPKYISYKDNFCYESEQQLSPSSAATPDSNQPAASSDLWPSFEIGNRSSDSDLKFDEESGDMSFDSLLSKSIPIRTRKGREVSHYKSGQPSTPALRDFSREFESEGRSPLSSLSKELRQGLESNLPELSGTVDVACEFNHQDDEIFDKIPSDSEPVSQHRTVSLQVLTDNESRQSLARGSNQKSSSIGDQMRQKPTTRSDRSARARRAARELLPGINIGEFVEQLQVRLVELQEKLIKSEAVSAQRKSQLLEAQRANMELQIENSNLRSLFLANKHCNLRTRGVSETTASSRHTPCLQDLPEPLLHFAERGQPGASFGNRYAVESCENEDNTS